MSQIDYTPTLPLLYTRGTHYEVGYQNGSAFQEWIKRFFNSNPIMQNLMLPFYHTRKGREIYHEYLKAAEDNFPQYIAEIRGMSEASAMPFEHLFLMNLTPEEYSINIMDSENEHESHVYGCSSVVLNRPDVKIIAHNEDCEPMNSSFAYIVSAHIIDHNAKRATVTCDEEQFTALTYAGTLPGFAFGFNKYGVVYALNEIEPKSINFGYPPVAFRSRAFLSACDVDDFVRIARNEGHGASVGFNANIASLNQKEMWSLEVGPGKLESPLELTVIAQQNDQDKPCHYFHFNYYKHLEGIEINPAIPSSTARSKRAHEIKPPRTIRDVKAVLGDTQNSSYPIFRRPKNPDQCITSCTVLFNILEKTTEIYVENPSLCNEPLWKLPLTF
ncbi:hypothetical protein ACJMK2_014573 [Sinanodonta woodiana]|uniref:Peptidase C45 hydrolase domain-containing protein n=1 Tax=Sinanodonta woodiana TaxID=1069815 RepID=A0ABD3V467_SINWO